MQRSCRVPTGHPALDPSLRLRCALSASLGAFLNEEDDEAKEEVREEILQPQVRHEKGPRWDSPTVEGEMIALAKPAQRRLVSESAEEFCRCQEKATTAVDKSMATIWPNLV